MGFGTLSGGSSLRKTPSGGVFSAGGGGSKPRYGPRALFASDAQAFRCCACLGAPPRRGSETSKTNICGEGSGSAEATPQCAAKWASKNPRGKFAFTPSSKLTRMGAVRAPLRRIRFFMELALWRLNSFRPRVPAAGSGRGGCFASPSLFGRATRIHFPGKRKPCPKLHRSLDCKPPRCGNTPCSKYPLH